MKPCGACGAVPTTAADAIYRGEEWFCDYKCLSKYLEDLIAQNRTTDGK